jgi:hypothetical protein
LQRIIKENGLDEIKDEEFEGFKFDEMFLVTVSGEGIPIIMWRSCKHYPKDDVYITKALRYMYRFIQGMIDDG